MRCHWLAASPPNSLLFIFWMVTHSRETSAELTLLLHQANAAFSSITPHIHTQFLDQLMGSAYNELLFSPL